MTTPRVSRERIRSQVAYAWVTVLSVLLLAPALRPGFVLSYDLVFTPQQDLLPGSLGVGGGLPRAVPQDAVVAIAEMAIPGQLLEKAALLAIPLLVGIGMLRLLGTCASGVVGATLAMANPYVLQRLVIGHWGLLIAYALVPWAVVVARRLRAGGDPWDGVRLLVLVALAALTPSGSLLVSIVAVPIAVLPGSALAPIRRCALAAAVFATWLPWLLPALLHPAGTGSDPDGARVFALRGDGPGGPVLSALTGGGIWNAEVVLPSRDSVLALALALLVGALAIAGAPRVSRVLGRTAGGWWLLVAVLGVLAALASTLLPGPWAAVLDAVPGGGIARDAHKFLAPWVLLVSAAAGAGAGRLVARVPDRASRIVLAGALAIAPVACQPDALWGAGGRLVAVDYPPAWSAAREAIIADGRPGDVASFPWASFRRFAWNDGRTLLDPAPRWMPRTTLVAGDLVIATPDGPIVVTGDDPRSAEVSRALTAGEDLGRVLPPLGVGWVLVAAGTPGPVPSLPGWDEVPVGAGLSLYAAPAGAVVPTEPDTRLVATVDGAVMAALAAALAALAIRRVRARGGRDLVR